MLDQAADQYSVVTATIVIPAGNGVSPAATGVTNTLGTPVYFDPVTGAIVNAGTGSGSAAAGAIGAAGAGSNAGSVCVCSAAPAVVATGIYTATVENVVNLGSVVYTTTYPTATLGVFTVVGGSVIPAVATITQSASAVANTNAALGAGQSYSTIIVPASGSTPAYTIVVVVTVINNVVAPVNGGNGNGIAAIPASTSGYYSNSTTSTAGSGAGVAALGFSTTAASTSTTAAVGGAIAATTTAAADATSVAPVAAVATTAVAGTNAVQVGSLGTTPLYNQQAFIDDILNYHNTLRARNGAGPLTWNADLANIALNNVNTNAAAGSFSHSRNIPALAASDPYGENIANQYGANNPDYLVWLWYEENQSYDYPTGSYSESTGHFTQVVWVASTELGCAYTQANDANKTFYLACEYNTPGNVVGEFQQNVLPMTATGQPAQPAANAS